MAKSWIDKNIIQIEMSKISVNGQKDDYLLRISNLPSEITSKKDRFLFQNWSTGVKYCFFFNKKYFLKSGE